LGDPVGAHEDAESQLYRLVPKHGKMVFIATVVSRELPTELRLSLEEPSVSVCIADKFVELTAQKTRLISEETFRLKGVFNKIFGFMAVWAINRAHRRHMESFKRFAEARALRSMSITTSNGE
jgi:hypothetical protein